MSVVPQVGSPAPDFTLPDESGTGVSLASLRGKHVVLYFYPKDDTPGCTTEARDFSRLLGGFDSAGAVVLGVSPDSEASHRKFKSKCDLQVRLLCDGDKLVHGLYGTWQQKSMYGRTYMGTARTTFWIDPAGTVARVWEKVKVAGHADEVLEAIRGG